MRLARAGYLCMVRHNMQKTTQDGRGETYEGRSNDSRERIPRDVALPGLRLGRATLLLPALTTLFMVARSPQLVIHPRMWFEEITWFYPLLVSHGPLYALSLIYRENYQFLTNIVVYAATLVPVENAAYITSYAALFFQGVAAYFFGLLIEAYGIRRWLMVPLAAVWALLPEGYEVFATATNIQWVCSISVLFILVAPLEKLSRGQRLFTVSWVLVCGLTGIPSCMLFWAFLIRAFWTRPHSSMHLVIGGILLACVVVQVAVLATHETPTSRHFESHIGLLVLPGLLQTALSPLLGVDISEVVAGRIKVDPTQKSALIFEVILVSSSIFLLALRLAWNSIASRCILLLLCSIWIGITLINTFGSIGDPTMLISGLHNGRYFMIGIMCLVLLLTLATASSDPTARQVATYLVCFLAVMFAGEVVLSPWNWLLYKFGPSWRELVQSCHGVRPCTVSVFGDWNVTLTQ